MAVFAGSVGFLDAATLDLNVDASNQLTVLRQSQEEDFKNQDKFYYRGPTLAGKPSQVKWPDQVNPPTETDPEPEP